MKKPSTKEMLELLLNSQNRTCAGIAHRILSGKSTAEEEMNFTGSFMTAVLKGDYDSAMAHADELNKMALIGDNPLAKSMYIIEECKKVGMDTTGMFDKLKEKKVSYIDMVFRIVIDERFEDFCDTHKAIELKSLTEASNLQEAKQLKHIEMLQERNNDKFSIFDKIQNAPPVVKEMLKHFGVNIPKPEDKAIIEKIDAEAQKLDRLEKVNRLMKIAKIVGMDNAETFDKLIDKSLDNKHYFEDIYLAMESVVAFGQNESNIKAKLTALLESNNKEEATKKLIQ